MSVSVAGVMLETITSDLDRPICAYRDFGLSRISNRYSSSANTGNLNYGYKAKQANRYIIKNELH